ncbi:uncharacterized protein DFL_005824 [Arthrobotrys flagrans]|uniref:tRNA(Ile)-lysidine synthetase n=1 Tax=Arthrobotrys flagrans TaxID=97331 RepID=A0A436ZZ63_ARTFL|nr:hypothetical protein DFL_005824 [Arthrobotrys flagrans]
MAALRFPTQAVSQTGPLAATEFVSLLRGVLDQAYISRHKEVEIPRHIGIAISGGVDSMALAHLAHKLSSFNNEFQRTDFRAMIVNHGLRKESTEEAESVLKKMESMGLLASLMTIPISAFSSTPLSKVESTARRQRYRLFAQSCQKYGISHLVTAHHANDQAETVLMRLVGGSGTAGLAGISPVAKLPECEDIYGADEILVLRPFLGVMKSRLKETLTADKITWHEDPTNKNVGLTPRNAIRAFLSPPPPKPPKSKRPQPPPTTPPPHLPQALTTTSLLNLSSTIAASNAKTQELVDWYLSRCILRHIHVSNVIEAFIPIHLLCMPLKLLTRVLAHLAAVISPLDRIDLIQMSKVAKNIMETTDPFEKGYSYVNHVNDINTVEPMSDNGEEVKEKKKKKDYREYYGKVVYYSGAITENNIFWEAVYCKAMSGRPEGVLLSCFRQPYTRKSARINTNTPEVDIDPEGDPNKWYLFDSRFWLRYSGDTNNHTAAFWDRLRRGSTKRVFITGTRKEVMYRVEHDGIRYDNTTDLSGKQMLSKLKVRWKSEAPGKSRTVLPVLCEEELTPIRKWKVPYKVLGFPTFGVGGDMMGEWEWKVKKQLVVGGVVIGNTPVTAANGKIVPL